MANLAPVKRFLRRAAGWTERRALAPLHAQVASIEARLEAIDRRLAAVQATVETTAARAAASIEYSQGVTESEARVARRIDAIEVLLGAKPPSDR